MPRRNGSRAAILESALVTLAGKNPPACPTKVAKAAHASGYPDEGKLFAVKLPRVNGVSVAYVAPQLDGKGKATVKDAGGKSWRSAWFSLTVNSYRRDGDGPPEAIALAGAIAGEPFVGFGGDAYLVVSEGMRSDRNK